MKHIQRIEKIVFATGIAVSIFFSGCSSTAQSTDSVQDTAKVASTAKTADYSVSKFKIKQTSTEVDSDADVFALLDITDPDGNKITLEKNDDSTEASYEADKYSITVSYELKTNQKKKTSTVIFKANVIDKVSNTSSSGVPSNTTVEYLYDGLLDTNEETLASDSKSSSKETSSKSTSSSKSSSSKSSPSKTSSSKSSSSSSSKSSTSSASTSSNSSSGSNSSSKSSTSSNAAASNNASTTTTQTQTQSQPAHTHTWKEHYATGTRTVTTYIHHDAVTQQVWIDQGSYELCNGCGEKIVGDPGLHAAEDWYEKGISNSSRTPVSVGYYETQVIQEAYDEPVESTETYQYVDYYYCDCGATK